MKLKIIIPVLSLFLFFASVSVVSAQNLSLSPATATKGINQEFQVDVMINTAGKAVAGADVKMTFDPAFLEVVRVDMGDFFSDTARNIGTGTLYIAGFFRAQFETKTGSGRMATITMKGKKVGSTPLTFVCSRQTNDSNILDGSANDIIDCAATTNGTYTLDTSVATSPTPTVSAGVTISPTVTPIRATVTTSVTRTATSSASPMPTVPVSGTVSTTIFIGAFGILLTLLGLALVL